MKQIINLIKARVLECERNGDMFSLPYLENVEIKEEMLPNESATLYHYGYKITLPDGRFIDIDYQSKDKCRSFQNNPDRSYIMVKCSDSSYDFSDAWDEKS